VQHLNAISPVLGAYNCAPGAFGFLTNPRYERRMTGSALEWTSEERAGAIVLAPSGRVDESTADAFREHLLEAISAKPATAIINLADVAYMSSRGLRALTLAQRAGQEAGTTIVLACPNETMREILAISRYDMVFRVADTIEAAIGH
jgi:anti-anti-sigma factor